MKILTIHILTLLFLIANSILRSELVHDWNFKEDQWQGKLLKEKVSNLSVTSEIDLKFNNESNLRLDGKGGLIISEIDKNKLPTKFITVEAVVTLNQGQKWGSIASYAQDNGSYERGWLLGYNEQSFLFWISTGKSIIQATSKTNFQPGKKYHVTGTYDGNNVRIFVNGKLTGQNIASGDIAYPERGFYAMGIYKDDDESYPMSGSLSMLRIYNSFLEEKNIEAIASSKGLTPFEFKVPPSLKYLSKNKVKISWGSESQGKMKLFYGKSRELDNDIEINSKDELYEVELNNIESDSIYYYKISNPFGKGSDTYEFNTNLNFTSPAAPVVEDKELQQKALSLLSASSIKAGYCLVIGSLDVGLLSSLCSQSEYSIIVIESDDSKIQRLRQSLYLKGLLGSRVNVLNVPDLNGDIPLTSCMVNFLISVNRKYDDEIKRILAPGRSIAVYLDGSSSPYIRPRLDDSGDWTHQYGDTGNTASSKESLSGAKGTHDFALQWVGRPGADFGIDRNPRMPAPLSANGRLFHQGMNRLVAMDAHNGFILWSLEAPDLRRVNIPRDCGNWCADSESLFVAIKDSAWMMNAEDGERKKVFSIPRIHEQKSDYEWGYIGRIGESLIGSAVKSESSYKNYWSGKMWYDGKGGEMGTQLVCSDSIFGYGLSSADNSKPWIYSRGLIINSTISGTGKQLYFVESRNKKLRQLTTGRIGGKEIWDDQFLVCLDSDTGKIIWEKAIDTENGTITFYLQSTENKIILTASNTKFHIYTFDPKTGNSSWSKSVNWPDDHHSGHMQHPVISGGVMYLQPNGHDINSGNLVTENMGKREGCHNYVGAGDALIYRGKSRQISMWSKDSESVTSWPRLRPSCWLNTIPSSGMLLIPEGGGGCSCGGWMETSLGFIPKVHLNKK